MRLMNILICMLIVKVILMIIMRMFLLLFGKDWFPDITCPLQTKTSQVAVPHVAQERQKFR